MSSITPMPDQPLAISAVITMMPGHEIVEVGPGRVEAGDLGHAAEQRAEQEQPDHRLDEGDRHEPRLPQQLARVALGHEVGLRDGGHA